MKQARLQTRLSLRLLAVLLGIGLVFGLSLNHYLRVLLETEVSDKASIVLSNVVAIQSYVRETLRPTMYGVLPPESFVIEAMSTSYVTRRVMSDYNAAKESFIYRRVALDPRNPEYGADERESELIAHFRDNPQETQISRYYRKNGEEFFIMARPVTFDESCLSCHGKPEDAPRVLLDRYGSERGFGRKDGEIAGLDSITMPVEAEAGAINRAMVNFILFFAFGTMLIMGLNHFFFDRMMVLNIGRLAAAMRSRFPAEAGRALDGPKRDGSDEIEGMVEDMERFADHLRDAREQLRDYAANLEAKVDERTAEARQEAQARQADVKLFLYVLELFAKGEDRNALLDKALAAAARRFGAIAAEFVCFYSMNARVWPADCSMPALESAMRTPLLDGEGVFLGREAMVPVQSASAVRGALCLRFGSDAQLPPQEREVLGAMGRQLGMALENLEAMESLLRRKAVLESIFEGIADPLFLLGPTGEVLHANESALKLLEECRALEAPSPGGEPGEGTLGLPALAAQVSGAVDAGEGGAPSIESEALLPGGRSLRLRAYPVSGLAGSGRAIVYARDNTVEKTMLAKLQQSEKATAVGMLAAGMAHEINNPLGVILCYARILWDDGQSPQAPDLDIIIRHTLQARKVLEDLLRFARPKPESLEDVNLADAVEFLARVFRGKASRANLSIVTDLPPDLPPVRANSSSLEQILTNLMLNAMDALEEQGQEEPGLIHVSARTGPDGSEVLLTVRDNGPGIPPDYAGRIFDPFFTTKNVGKGTGLGLSVVYGLVRDLGGHIDVRSEGGAVFTVGLPVSKDIADA
ncbi:c-type heme family protein [Fundidesulfovibrio soli]|uniref:c-type heme family protein n=1 Tax=Fundidesulfovibrio soli TaxID=2922716 RepID=UPI001FB04642